MPRELHDGHLMRRHVETCSTVVPKQRTPPATRVLTIFNCSSGGHHVDCYIMEDESWEKSGASSTTYGRRLHIHRVTSHTWMKKIGTSTAVETVASSALLPIKDFFKSQNQGESTGQGRNTPGNRKSSTARKRGHARGKQVPATASVVHGNLLI